MGNYRFKLSDMMPNAWFYKLKDMGKKKHHPIKKQHHQRHPPPPPKHQSAEIFSLPRESYYYSTSDRRSLQDRFQPFLSNPKIEDDGFPGSPREPKKRPKRRSCRSSPRRASSSSSSSSLSSAGCRCRATLECCSASSDGNATPLFSAGAAADGPGDRLVRKFDGLDSAPGPEVDLPPVLTKPPKPKNKNTSAVQFIKESSVDSSAKERAKRGSAAARKLPYSSASAYHSASPPAIQGLKLRVNSPRLASRKLQAAGRRSASALARRRKSLSESFAVVKSSSDPQRDFRESMVEMILENDLRGSKDLEDLLACYLSLNSDEYHDVIVKVFEQVWFDLRDIQL